MVWPFLILAGWLVIGLVVGYAVGRAVAFGQRPVPQPTRQVFDRERMEALRRLNDFDAEVLVRKMDERLAKLNAELASERKAS